jgi:predicted RNase H-like HicB family nuclease
MDKIYLTAIFEQGENCVGVTFPDLPGCVAVGDNFADAATKAEEALALHLSGMIEDGKWIDLPRLPHEIEADPEVKEIARVLIGAVDQPSKARVNLMLDQNLLNAVDARHSNRSAFFNRAGRLALREGM